MYIRPQDWVPGFLGLPTATILIPLGLIAGYQNYVKNPKRFQLPQIRLLALYLIVIFISTFLNTDIANAWDQFFTFFKRVLCFFLILWCIDTEKKIKACVNTMMVFAVFLTYQAYLQHSTGFAWGELEPYFAYGGVIRSKWHGQWDGPNVLAILFMISAALILEYVLGKHSFGKKIVSSSLLFITLAGIYFTNSRGAILAVAVAVVFYFKDKLLTIKALAIGAPATMGVFLLAPSRVTTISSEEDSARERTWLWEQGLRMYRENPVWGVGRGEFSGKTDVKLIAHNNYVQDFAELGSMGFFSFIALLWFTFKGLWLIEKHAHTNFHSIRSLGKAMQVMLISYAAITFFVVMEVDILFVMMGLCASTYVVARDEDKNIPIMKFTKSDTIFIFGGMFTILVMIWLAAIKHII